MTHKVPSYIPAFDILRAILSLGILCYHMAWLKVGFGQAIMESFFVLSGFLVTKSLFSGHSNNIILNRRDVLRFWFRRLVRLGPALWCFVAISIVICFIFDKGFGIPMLSVGLGSSFWTANYLTIYWNSHGGSIAPFGGLWSLSIEEQFYFCLPVLSVAGIYFAKKIRLNSKVLISIFLIIVAFSAYFMRFFAYLNDCNIRVVSYSIQYRMFGFALGSLSYLIVSNFKRDISLGYRKGAYSFVSFLSIIIIFCCMSVKSYSLESMLFEWALVPIALALILLLLYILSISSSEKKISTNRNVIISPLVFLGKASYSIYLYHPLVLFLMGQPKGFSWKTGIGFVLSVTLGILSHLFVEEYFGNKMRRIIKKI